MLLYKIITDLDENYGFPWKVLNVFDELRMKLKLALTLKKILLVFCAKNTMPMNLNWINWIYEQIKRMKKVKRL